MGKWDKYRKNRDNNKEEKNISKTNINWYPGHMAKTRRQIKENIDMVDIIYEVIDSRIPYSSKIKDIDDLIKNKPRILIMTKYDLCDKKKTDKWKEKYEKYGYKVLTLDLINGNSESRIMDETNNLLKELNNKRLEKGLKKRAYRALVIGIPNVGKSTLINKLAKRKSAIVGNRPGVTKNLSWINVNSELQLMDSPGILWPKLDDETVSYNLASFSAIKEEILPLGKVACYILNYLYNNYPNSLLDRYNINYFNIDDVIPTYDIIGKKRGCIVSGGEVDYDKVSSIIINDLKEGKLGFVTFDEVK